MHVVSGSRPRGADRASCTPTTATGTLITTLPQTAPGRRRRARAGQAGREDASHAARAKPQPDAVARREQGAVSLTAASPDLLRELVAISSPSGDEARGGRLRGSRFLHARGYRLSSASAHSVDRLRLSARPGTAGPAQLPPRHGADGARGGASGSPCRQRLGGRPALRPRIERCQGQCGRHAVGPVEDLAKAGHSTGEGGRAPCYVALTACEETVNTGMTQVRRAPRTGARLDGAVTGEPTGLQVVRAQSGLVGVDAPKWTGRSCHAAHVARVEHRQRHDDARPADLARMRDRGPDPGGGAPPAGPEHGRRHRAATPGERHNVVPDSRRSPVRRAAWLRPTTPEEVQRLPWPSSFRPARPWRSSSDAAACRSRPRPTIRSWSRPAVRCAASEGARWARRPSPTWRSSSGVPGGQVRARARPRAPTPPTSTCSLSELEAGARLLPSRFAPAVPRVPWPATPTAS